MTTPTAASGDSAYCTVTQFLEFVDDRSVRDLLSDDGTRTAGSLAANATLLLLLGAASGEVEAAACAGQRYVIDPGATPPRNDLAALTGNSASLLARMVAWLAFHDLWSRRPSEAPLHPQAQRALDFLERLRLGERVLGVLENHQAGHVEADLQSAAEVTARGGIVVTAERYFGLRNDRLQRLP